MIFEHHSSRPVSGLYKSTLAAIIFLAASGFVRANAAVPVLSATLPLTVQPGVTTSVILKGAGFSNSSVVTVNGVQVPVAFVNAGKLIAQVPVPAAATGSVAIKVTNPAPGGTSTFIEKISPVIDNEAAARLLDQTTFGPTAALIKHVEQEGASAWLTEQFNMPASQLAAVPYPAPAVCGPTGQHCVQSEWWNVVLNNNDQLRQRVALALSEILVISSGKDYFPNIPPYHNVLSNDAFTNWYKIMTDVTLSPGMGFYLDMVNSPKTSDGQIANENFGRENLQLFNLGLSLLNQDGTPQLDSSGAPIPSYTELQVEAFARAYTGWTYANTDGTAPKALFNKPNYAVPMVAVESQHDESEKILLNGTVLPAGQTAEEDLAGALTNIFQHPNVPPFISQQLIQKLVKGNPSPAYVARVAAVFTDNGQHVRGDMKSVITAILTDPEARVGDTIASSDAAEVPAAAEGHLREPMLYASAILRGVGFTNLDPNGNYFSISDYTQKLGERPYVSPSVFNFYPPDYVIPGTAILSPEFSLENTGSIGIMRQFADILSTGREGSAGVLLDLSATSPLGEAAADPDTLLDTLTTIFLHGRIDPNVRATIINEISGYTDPAERARLATYLVVTSAVYRVNI